MFSDRCHSRFPPRLPDSPESGLPEPGAVCRRPHRFRQWPLHFWPRRDERFFGHPRKITSFQFASHPGSTRNFASGHQFLEKSLFYKSEKCSAKAPLQGELSAQLTEEFRLGESQASPKANYWALCISGAVLPLSAEAFHKKSRNPSVSLTRASSPCRGGLGQTILICGAPIDDLPHEMYYNIF